MSALHFVRMNIMPVLETIEHAATTIVSTTWGRVAIIVVIALVAMFLWGRSEGMAPSAKDRIFGVIPLSAAKPARRTY